MMPAVSFRKTLLALFLSLCALGCGTSQSLQESGSSGVQPPLEYHVDLTDRTGDTFKVTLAVQDLGPENAIYQFASTAPGTYQVMDIGRFVRSFEALDADGNTISTEQVSTNQWRIDAPERVAEIQYTLAETWDTPVSEHSIYMMAGTSIEDDHVLINGQAVFGYPTGMQARPLRITLDYPAEWKLGTALNQDASGAYLAKNYDHAVDSPILIGRLSVATLDVRGTAIEIYTYSKTDKVHSDQILAAVEDILDSAGDFLVTLPVDRYTFLMHFEDVTMGAWEHSYSSEYVFAEEHFEFVIDEGIPDIVAHEFYHIVTPLNIHSEVVEYFNFVEPVASEHVWLYEGTTEWVAHIAQLRSGLISLDEYLSRLSEKMQGDDSFDKNFSLSQIGLESFSEKGQQQWGNIYQRGALVAGLLDIKLLELSDGTHGMREVLLDLSERFGPDTSFSEATFFDDFAAMTHPDVRPFFDAYVRDTQPLPMADYYAKLGITYTPEVNTGEQEPALGLQAGVDEDQQIVITHVAEIGAACGFEEGDVITGLNDMEITLQTAQQAFGVVEQLDVGEPFDLTIRRGDEEHTYTCAKQLVDQVATHVFEVNPNATPEQLALRAAWAQNLPVVAAEGSN